ncbi:LysR family transcriptional regulator [Pandoraea bronchicola]|uniref:LysR family transcriptional regulator n=1 Tax=Pandoraea bronchicola TaxID=2508287 RepID=A0A5E5BYM3_9BURK|nr:LysR family transcriptional regulator [Pandoraea bronchicola]VVE90517.1 LysR family transcriptional regulator [Pandoraea bronchicola]
MEYRHLRIFIVVFEERNITAAANRLNLTQPAISSIVKQLETALGVALFVRHARGVEVTECARRLYPLARNMVAELDRLRQRFRQPECRVTLELGVDYDIAGVMVCALAERIERLNADVTLHLHDGCYGGVRLASEESLREDELFAPLWVEPYVLAHSTAGSYAYAAGSDVLKNPRWVTCPSHSTHQRLIPLYGPGADAPFARATSLRRALDIVAAGQGVAVAPHSLVSERSGIRWRSIPAMTLERRVGLCIGAQALSTPHISWLYAEIL